MSEVKYGDIYRNDKIVIESVDLDKDLLQIAMSVESISDDHYDTKSDILDSIISIHQRSKNKQKWHSKGEMKYIESQVFPTQKEMLEVDFNRICLECGTTMEAVRSFKGATKGDPLVHKAFHKTLDHFKGHFMGQSIVKKILEI